MYLKTHNYFKTPQSEQHMKHETILIILNKTLKNKYENTGTCKLIFTVCQQSYVRQTGKLLHISYK
jgi:hypothetical protein